MKKHNYLLIIGFLGALAVGLGAFGAHALKEVLDAKHLAIYHKGIDYHFYHCLAAFATWLILDRYDLQTLRWAVNSFFLGIVLFSGSLYLLACAEVLGIQGFRVILGPMTPLGGTCFIIGWIMLILSAQKIKNHE